MEAFEKLLTYPLTTIESQEAQPSGIDQDVELALSMENPEERAVCMHSVWNTLNYARHKDLKEIRIKEGGPLRHYSLPGIGSARGHDEIVEEYYQDYNPYRGNYQESVRNRFMTIEQGYAWEIPPDKENFAMATMSDCSFLVGHTPDNGLLAAHISYSEMQAVRGALALFKERKVDLATVRAIMSVAPTSPRTAFQDPKINDRLRPAEIEDYLEQGILEDHIHPFRCSIETTEEGEAYYKGCMLALISPKELYLGLANYYYRRDGHDRNGRTYGEKAIAW